MYFSSALYRLKSTKSPANHLFLLLIARVCLPAADGIIITQIPSDVYIYFPNKKYPFRQKTWLHLAIGFAIIYRILG